MHAEHAEAWSESQVMEAEVITAAFGLSVAENELADFGIVASPADAAVWLSASNRARRHLALEWATYVAKGDPAWKAR
jgi:hypothetical protein